MSENYSAVLKAANYLLNKAMLRLLNHKSDESSRRIDTMVFSKLDFESGIKAMLRTDQQLPIQPTRAKWFK
jgi:hypothetical protein